jgi:aryl-alcohol dehydrogenase-like predicted oxidoreductase
MDTHANPPGPADPVRLFGPPGERRPLLGLGGSSLAAHSLEQGVATVQRALDLGVGYFDTSPAYCQGASQVVLGSALEGRGEPHAVATKLGYLETPASFRSPDALRAQLWENLRALRRARVDLLQVHLAELAAWWEDGAAPGAMITPGARCDFRSAPVLQVMREARANGACGAIGITCDRADSAAWILRHVEVDAVLVAYDYTVMERRARRGVLPLAAERGTAYIAAGVLKTMPVDPSPRWRTAPPPGMTAEIVERALAVDELRRSHGLSMVELSLRYLVADRSISAILVGASTPGEIEESVAALGAGPLPLSLQRDLEGLEPA